MPPHLTYWAEVARAVAGAGRPPTVTVGVRYEPCSSTVCITWDKSLSVGFAAAFLVKLYSAPVRILYILSFPGFVDLMGTVPIFFFNRYKAADTPGIDILVFLRVLSLFAVRRRLGVVGNTVRRRILLLTGSVLVMVFVFAGIFQWIERRKVFSEDCRETECPDFYKSFYFMIVTVSTVGYGDITPKTSLGRCVIMVTIAAALILVPQEVAKIVDLASRRPYGGSYSPRAVTGTRFVILSGSIPYQSLRNFLAEFYHPVLNADLAAFPLKVVVMGPHKPSFQVRTLLSSYDHHVRFMEGSPMEEADLERVSAKVATAFYLLAAKNTEDFAAEDSAQMARALCVSKFCGPNVRVLVELRDPESLDSPFWRDNSNIELLCPEELRLKLLARSCHVRGISTLVCSLFVSALAFRPAEENCWLDEYYNGLEKEIYPVLLPKIFTGMEFAQVARTVYKEFEALLIGLDVDNEDGEGRVLLLNPTGRIVQGKDVGLVIAESLEVVIQISAFQEDDEKLFSTCHCLRKLRFCRCFSTDRRGSLQEQLIEEMEAKSQKRGSATSNSWGNWELKSGQQLRTLPQRSMIGHLAPKRRHESGASCMGNRRSVGLPNMCMPMKSKNTVNEGVFDIVCPREHNMITKNDSRDGTAAEAASFDGLVGGAESTVTQQECPIDHQSEIADSIVDMMLQWPPVYVPGKPKPSVLEFNQEKIAANLQERTRSHISTDEAHVLVCCEGKWPRNLFYFIEHFRIPGLPNPPIVILSPNKPSTEQWGSIGLFKDVFYIKGSGTFDVDLHRARILQAEHTVVFGEDFSLDGGADMAADGEVVMNPKTHAMEVTNSLVVTNVERWVGEYGNSKVIGEMMYNQSFRYLKPMYQIHPQTEAMMSKRKMRDARFLFLPCYAEGKGFPSSMIDDVVLSSSFTIRNTANLILQFLEGGKIAGRTDAIQLLDMMPVPHAWDGLAYGEVFCILLHEAGMLSVGLYRAAGTLGSPTAYVYTSPRVNTIVRKEDYLYVFREARNDAAAPDNTAPGEGHAAESENQDRFRRFTAHHKEPLTTTPKNMEGEQAGREARGEEGKQQGRARGEEGKHRERGTQQSRRIKTGFAGSRHMTKNRSLPRPKTWRESKQGGERTTGESEGRGGKTVGGGEGHAAQSENEDRFTITPKNMGGRSRVEEEKQWARGMRRSRRINTGFTGSRHVTKNRSRPQPKM
ncbi:hypothetical protein CBR_g30987 [Chara braunii]|uniref:Potassium channel domain-containing protein n=1 Tax=Chara braunii TaxID=69332 RepID=A0A388LDZ2_CHABU|nr:hypothetical protein CBR_g30987 [Chara braunii]|eukprot:GBG80526.1 hypothetical protein CBR_g30987 [Chara braunii]